ncbi:hypothetical protein [Ferruginibacter albus]|nr:hypothetical protein [Ferruginibacter albus]UAY52727.1 hypothetical protein K9M53_03305 [Ferruginibacter albus]
MDLKTTTNGLGYPGYTYSFVIYIKATLFLEVMVHTSGNSAPYIRK